MWQNILTFFQSTGFAGFGASQMMVLGFIPGEVIMLVISCVLLYLGIARKFEPLLLVPIAFGMLLSNLPLGGVFNAPTESMSGGLIYYLYYGVKMGIYPPLIFMGVGAMTDFGPLIANPKSLLLGAAAQIGIFVPFVLAFYLGQWFPSLGFDLKAAASIGIIGGADGPTAIYLTSKLKPELLGPIAIAAYSYMALVPLIQPPIMMALTTKKERAIKMDQLREVTKVEKIVFPIAVTIFIGLILPAAVPLLGSLMLGNLFRETGLTNRLSDTAQNALINILTIFLGISVGATANAARFLQPQTLMIIALGLFAFSCGTAAGVLFGKLMNWFSGGKVNPLIGSAGVSAVPMAARVSQVVGQKADPSNYLLMHAMGPNVAGVIGSAVAAGVMLSFLG
ncbi:MAG TPA: sodium ion-translocating decarboxylase subunit beta [bacterium]|nr:sodium ion-translocating decarboxylase subunit beta [bacterium]